MTTQPSSARLSRTQGDVDGAVVRRRWVVAAVVVPLLAGCGSTSFGAQTSQVYQPGPGITVRSSDVYVFNALVVTDGDGNGTLVGGLINQVTRTDTLQSVALTTPQGKQVDATILPGTVSLPDQLSVQLADTGDVRFGGDLEAGLNYSLTLTFANAAPVTVIVPVLTDAAEFATVPVGPTPTPTTPSTTVGG